MKKRIGLLVVLLLAIGVAIFLLTPGGSSRVPRFVPGKVVPVGNYSNTHYNWLHLRPFVNDKVWVFGQRNGTNAFFCLYDLREHVILGELENAGAVMVNHDGTKLLCEGPDSAAISIRSAFIACLRRITGRKIGAQINQFESFWVLDLRDNSAKRVGATSQFAGTGSRWYSSPGLRYGCTRPTTEPAFMIFDFAKEQITRSKVDGRIIGWWDDQNIFYKDRDNNFSIYDVVNEKSVVLIRVERLAKKLQGSSNAKAAEAEAFANWNGREYDFYLAEKEYEFRAKRSFLFKIERTTPEPTLSVVAWDFKFEWGGHLNADGTQFLYQGESGAPGSGGNGGVYLRDLSDSSVRTIVPPDNRGQYAIPRFYSNEVIYFRNRTIWRIGLDGSDDTPLFPTNSPTKP